MNDPVNIQTVLREEACRDVPDNVPQGAVYWLRRAADEIDAKERECERLRELAMEARDFLAEHELNVFGAGANLFTKLCAALKERP